MWRISGTKGLCNNVPTVDGPIVEGSLNEKKIITDRKNSGGETGTCLLMNMLIVNYVDGVC